MTKAEEYRQRAKECERMATNTKDPEAKRAFTEAAHQWRHLAAQVGAGAMVAPRLVDKRGDHEYRAYKGAGEPQHTMSIGGTKMPPKTRSVPRLHHPSSVGDAGKCEDDTADAGG